MQAGSITLETRLPGITVYACSSAQDSEGYSGGF